MPATVARRRASRMTAGLTLLTMAFAGAVAAVVPATAQSLDEDPVGAETQPLEITETALYASPIFDAVPPTLRNQVPPEAVCVVQPDLCPESSEPIRNLLVDTLATISEEFPVSPVQPVPPDSAAISFFGGHTRYQTAIKFDLPTPPANEEIVSFTVEFDQGQPSYDLNSPAFRAVILAVFETIGPQDPEVLVEGLIAALDESPLEVDGDVIGIEACPLLSPFEPEGAPQAQHSDELPRRELGENDTEVDVDCILGSGGVRGDDDVWTFDLTFTAAAWAAGDIENHGLLLRPTNAPNLAFGDPDTSTNAQVILDTSEVRAAMETAEPLPEPEPMAPMEDGFEDDLSFDEGGVDGGFDDGGFEDGASFDADEPIDAGFSDSPDLDAEFADDDLAAAPMDEEPAQAAPMVTAGDGAVQTPWWVWLLVPAFFGGAYLTSQALMAPAVTTAGASGSGALSRLIAQSGPPASSPAQQV